MKIYLCDSAEMFPVNVMFYSHYVNSLSWRIPKVKATGDQIKCTVNLSKTADFSALIDRNFCDSVTRQHNQQMSTGKQLERLFKTCINAQMSPVFIPLSVF